MRALPAGLLVLLLPGLACLDSGVVQCDEWTCAPGLVCSPYLDGCVEPDHIDCGNGVVDEDQGEVCDVRDPSPEAGPCSTTCRSDLSCGNGIMDPGELCDDGPANNPDTGHCTAECKLHCGDGKKNSAEDCDGRDLGSVTCIDHDYDMGALGCTDECRLDLAQCRRIGWFLDDGMPADIPPIRAVWSSPGGTVFAVGEQGTFLRRDSGGTWYRLAGVPTSTDLLDVWGVHENNVYAVGTDGTVAHWREGQVSVKNITSDPLVAVWGPSALPVYAVSASGLMYRKSLDGGLPRESSSGEVWTAAGRVPSFQARDLWGLGQADDHEAYLFSPDGQLYRYDRQGIASVSNVSGVHAVWGTGDTLVAVGKNGRIYHYDGQGWEQKPSGTSAQLLSVWGSSRDDVFAAGADGVALYFNGSDWQRIDTMPASGDTSALYTPQRFVNGFSTSGANVFAVDGNDGRLWRYEGIVWGVGPDAVRGMWGQGEGEVFAVTAVTATLGQVWRYDGASWSPLASAAAPLRAIGGSQAGELYAVGARGTVLHHDGAAWQDLSAELDQAGVWNSSPAPDLSAVWVSDDGQVFIAGAAGTAIHRDPDTGAWTGMETGTSSDFTALRGRSSAEVYATTLDGRVYLYDQQWQIHNVPGTDPGTHPPALHGLWSNAQELYMVGESYYYDVPEAPEKSGWRHGIWRRAPGSLWFAMDTGMVSSSPQPTLHAVWSDGPDNIYVAGQDGVVLHFNGQSWFPVRPYNDNNTQTLMAAWGTLDTAFFGGDSGTMMLHRTDPQRP